MTHEEIYKRLVYLACEQNTEDNKNVVTEPKDCPYYPVEREYSHDSVIDCISCEPVQPIVNKSAIEHIIDVCLDVCEVYGEERTRKIIEVKERLGIASWVRC